MALEFYLKLDGIDGESSDSKHKDWIEVTSYSHAVEQEGASRSGGGQSTVGRASFADFSVVKRLDKASPKLSKYCASGEHIKSAKMELCQATKDKHPYMKYELTDVVISSVKPSGHQTTDSFPLEEVGMRFSKIAWEYTPMDAAGKVQAAQKANWDLKTNVGG
jgi:type VI secretion system secreted protein Hcp